MRRNRVLIALWAITIFAFASGFAIAPGLSVAAQFFAFILAGVSVKRAERLGELRNKIVYRGALLLLLAAAATVVVTAGSTVAFETESTTDSPFVGFIALASLNLIVAILAWRALVKPAPRRAAFVGLIAVVVELFAIIVDVMINLHQRWPADDFTAVAFIASWAATWAGALVCIAALISFEPAPMVNVPGVRVVDET